MRSACLPALLLAGWLVAIAWFLVVPVVREIR